MGLEVGCCGRCQWKREDWGISLFISSDSSSLCATELPFRGGFLPCDSLPSRLQNVMWSVASGFLQVMLGLHLILQFLLIKRYSICLSCMLYFGLYIFFLLNPEANVHHLCQVGGTITKVFFLLINCWSYCFGDVLGIFNFLQNTLFVVECVVCKYKGKQCYKVFCCGFGFFFFKH